MAETWTHIDDPTAFQDDAVFEIDKATKSIQVLVEQPIVAGENKSQFIKFQMGRYYDAIDLTQMEVNILYESPTGFQDINSAVNREYSDEYIRFGWLVPYAACSEKGTLYFAVEFVGSDYVLKTTKGSTPVLDSIKGSSTVPEPVEQIWYIELQSQVAAAINNANSTLETVTELVETFQGGIDAAIADWLSEHPEATTTVQDGTITEAKLADPLKPKVIKDYITPEMYGAKGDGETDDLSAFQSAISAMSAGDVLYIPAKTYLLSDTLTINKAVTVIGDGTIYVTHASPVIVLDSVDNAVIDLAKIEKSARVFDYEEGSSAYSIAVILKSCGGCNVNIHDILNTTTAFLLLADGTGCHYNQIQCDDAHTFTGIEIVRTSNGGWVNGNRINAFRWMVNTWQDNTDLIPGYMIKSLSYATESENEPYRNNANFFDHLVAEYGAKAADYPILLCRLDYARGYTLHFERSEISPKEASLTNNSFYFTNSTYCVAFVWFSVYSIKSNIGSLGTDHNLIVKKADFEAVSFSGIQSILSSVTLNSNLSYIANWFQIVKNASTKSVRIFGELTVNAELANISHLIEGLPTCRQGWGTMILTPSITETQWQAAGTVTHYKLSITSGRTFLANVGAIPAGTHLFLDFEYLIAEDDL